jgi:nitrate reductase NapAB chaperone NapD
MNICSCVVHTKAGRGAQVAKRLGALPGVEVLGGIAEGKLVVTLEDASDAYAADTLGALNQVPGVTNTILIYHYGGNDISDEIPAEEHSNDHHPA